MKDNETYSRNCTKSPEKYEKKGPSVVRARTFQSTNYTINLKSEKMKELLLPPFYTLKCIQVV